MPIPRLDLEGGRVVIKKSKNNIFKELTYQQMFGRFKNYFIVTFDCKIVHRRLDGEYKKCSYRKRNFQHILEHFAYNHGIIFKKDDDSHCIQLFETKMDFKNRRKVLKKENRI